MLRLRCTVVLVVFGSTAHHGMADMSAYCGTNLLTIVYIEPASTEVYSSYGIWTCTVDCYNLLINVVVDAGCGRDLKWPTDPIGRRTVRDAPPVDRRTISVVRSNENENEDDGVFQGIRSPCVAWVYRTRTTRQTRPPLRTAWVVGGFQGTTVNYSTYTLLRSVVLYWTLSISRCLQLVLFRALRRLRQDRPSYRR